MIRCSAPSIESQAQDDSDASMIDEQRVGPEPRAMRLITASSQLTNPDGAGVMPRLSQENTS
jgi:hypothetical protein